MSVKSAFFSNQAALVKGDQEKNKKQKNPFSRVPPGALACFYIAFILSALRFFFI